MTSRRDRGREVSGGRVYAQSHACESHLPYAMVDKQKDLRCVERRGIMRVNLMAC